LRAFRELRRPTSRRAGESFLLEGPNLFERLIEHLERDVAFPFRLESFLVSDPYLARYHERGFEERCRRLGVEGDRVSVRTMASLSDVRTAPGILAIVRPPPDARDLGPRAAATTAGSLLFAFGVSDPGNLGTLARSAAAFGAGAFLTAGGADPFGPKVLRASAGDFFSLPYGEVREPERFLEQLGPAGIQRIGAVSRGGVAPDSVRIAGPYVILVGSERHGLPESWDRFLDVRVTIPLDRNVESLNAAVAGSILLHTFRARR